jgi:hypothetical protein
MFHGKGKSFHNNSIPKHDIKGVIEEKKRDYFFFPSS